MDIRDLANDDVVRPTNGQIHLCCDFIRQFRDTLGTQPRQWFEQGAEIEFLRASGGGWQKGKIRLRLEIIPDEPKPGDDPNSLDSIRKLYDQ